MINVNEVCEFNSSVVSRLFSWFRIRVIICPTMPRTIQMLPERVQYHRKTSLDTKSHKSTLAFEDTWRRLGGKYKVHTGAKLKQYCFCLKWIQHNYLPSIFKVVVFNPWPLILKIVVCESQVWLTHCWKTLNDVT